MMPHHVRRLLYENLPYHPWNAIRFLHENLPYPFLKLWGSSEQLVSLSRYIGYGGKRYAQYYSLMAEMHQWGQDKIYEFQVEELKKLLRHSYDNVPYYRETFDKEGLKPKDIKCLEDLEKLPVITKEDILANYNKFFARNLWFKPRLYRYTSGTSGMPLKTCMDNDTIAACCASAMHFRRNVVGRDDFKKPSLCLGIVDSRMSLFLVRTDFFNKKKPYFYTPIFKYVIFYARPDIRFGDETFKECASCIQRLNIKYGVGSASLFFAFARYVKRKNIDVKLERVSTFGEMLYEFQRRFIEKNLGCEVFQTYGSVEIGYFASECEKHNGMHTSPITAIAQVDEGVGLRDKGRIVITTLCNYLWPLIRYSSKDIISFSYKKCSCGCAFPRIMSVEGRDNDFIMLPDGHFLHSSPFGRLVFIPGVEDIFFLQNEDYSLDIFVVKGKKADAANLKRSIEQKAKELSENKLKVRVVFKDFIERKSRKHRIVETKVPTFFKVQKVNRGPF